MEIRTQSKTGPVVPPLADLAATMSDQIDHMKQRLLDRLSRDPASLHYNSRPVVMGPVFRRDDSGNYAAVLPFNVLCCATIAASARHRTNSAGSTARCAVAPWRARSSRRRGRPRRSA